MKPYFQHPRATLWKGDCLAVLKTLPDCSVDAVVTDPPAGISFMGKDWDSFKIRKRTRGSSFSDGRARTGIACQQETSRRGRDIFISWLTEIMSECLRVLKPGGHALVWAIPRTSHWTATACEDAGFEIRDRVSHFFGSGFPKSLDVSKAIDKAAGATRRLGPKRVSADGTVAHDSSGKRHEGYERPWRDDPEAVDRNTRISYPATEAAVRWSGFGTALKPACEDWWLCRKMHELAYRAYLGATDVCPTCGGHHVKVDDCNEAFDRHRRAERAGTWNRRAQHRRLPD